MRRRSGIWIVIGIMITGLLFFLAQSVIFSDETALLSKTEAENRLADQVGGDYVFQSESGNDFTFEIKREQGVYLAKVSREDGSIIDLTRETTIEDDDQSNEDSDQGNQSNQNADQNNQNDQTDDENNAGSTDDQNSNENDQENNNENGTDNNNETNSEEDDEPQQQRLNANEVSERVRQEFEGEITSVELNDASERYTVVIEQELTRIQLEIDAMTGEIVARETEDTTPELAVTEEEATTIALEQVEGEGEVANVQLQEIDDIIFYRVTINSTAEEQAIVEINGFSGNVETVTWTEQNDNGTNESENENNQNEEEGSD